MYVHTVNEMSSFVSIVNDYYKCMTCGVDVEQKINGVIKYLPIGKDTLIEKDNGRPKYGLSNYKKTPKKRPGRHANTILSAFHTEKNLADRVDIYPTNPYILLYERKKYAKNNKQIPIKI